MHLKILHDLKWNFTIDFLENSLHLWFIFVERSDSSSPRITIFEHTLYIAWKMCIQVELLEVQSWSESLCIEFELYVALIKIYYSMLISNIYTL